MKSDSVSNLIKLTVKAMFIAVGGVVFPFLYILFPYQFVSESIKEGIIKTMASFLAVCLLLALLIGPGVGIGILTLFGPMILIFNYMIVNKKDVDLTIIVTAVIFFVSMILNAYTLGITPEMLKSQETINKFIEFQGSLMQSGNVAVDIADQTAALTVLYNKSLQIMPAILLLVSLFLSYITYSLTGRSLIKANKLIIQPNSFIFFRLPVGMIVSGIIGVLGVYIFQDIIGGNYKIIIDNIMIVYSALLFFQGLSIAKFFMVRARVNNFLQLLIVLGALLIPGAQIIFIILAVVDIVMNFRGIPG